MDSLIKVKKYLENVGKGLYNLYIIAETALKASPTTSTSILQDGVKYGVYSWNFCAVFVTKLALAQQVHGCGYHSVCLRSQSK